MAQLRVTSAKLRETKGQLNSQNQRLQNQINNLQNIQRRLTRMWDGPANTTFDSVFTRDVVQFTNFSNLITKYADVLGQAADTYDDRERKNIELASKR